MYPDSWHALIAGEPKEVVDKVFHDIFEWLDKRSLPVGEPSIKLWEKALIKAGVQETATSPSLVVA